MTNCETTSSPLTIFQGADATFDVILALPDRTPFDLTTVTPLKAFFKNADDTVLEVGLGTGVTISSPATSGKINITLTEAQTELLKAGRNQSIELEITDGSDVRIVQLIGVMEVKKRLFV